MSASILKSFTFVPQPKINNDPLIIKRERINVVHQSSCNALTATDRHTTLLRSLTDFIFARQA